MAGRLQGADIKTSTEIVAAGGTIAQLPTDDQSYVTANGINKTLKQAITDGDIGGGSGAGPWIQWDASSYLNGFGTVSGADFFYRINGTAVEIIGRFTCGTTTATQAQLLLPDPSWLTVPTTNGYKYKVGRWEDVFTSAGYPGFDNPDLMADSTAHNYVLFSFSDSTRSQTNFLNGNDIANLGTAILINAVIPASGLPAGGGANSIYDIQFGSAVTSDSTRSSSTYGAPTNIPSITFTPTASCVYKISCPFNFYGTLGNTNYFKIENTVGSATLISQSDVIQDATTGIVGTFNDEAIAYYQLSSGVSYTFELWCKSSVAGLITINNSYATSGIKMVAEGVGYTAASPLIGIIKYPANASSQWPTGGSVGSYSGYGTNANAATMVVVNGALTAPSTTVPGFNMNVVAGTSYRITATGQFAQNVSGYCKFRFTDGTDSTEQAGTASALSGFFSSSAGTIVAIYTPSTSGLKTIEIQAQTSAGQSTIYNDSGLDLVFTAERV